MVAYTYNSRLRKVIDDKSGILKRMSAKEANATVKQALMAGGEWFVAEELPKVYTKQVRRAPWHYRGDPKAPMVKTGMARDMARQARVVARASGRGSKAGVRVTIPQPWYVTGRARRESRTYAQIIKIVGRFAKAKMVDEIEKSLVAILNGAETKKIHRGVKAGDYRVRLTKVQRGVMGL